jgi:type VI secretion system protein ImpF
MPAPSRIPIDALVTLSVLDRLIDRDPRNSADESVTRAQSVRQLKAALRRDLEWLLNTRRIAVEPGESLRQLRESLYVYGLPDFMAMSLASPKDQAKLVRALQTAVKLLEPRLADVRIVPLEAAQAARTLRFRIEGLLRMDPAPEQVSFDTVLDLTSAEYAVQGESNAG